MSDGSGTLGPLHWRPFIDRLYTLHAGERPIAQLAVTWALLKLSLLPSDRRPRKAWRRLTRLVDGPLTLQLPVLPKRVPFGTAG